MKKVLTISEFAKMAGVSRQTLIYYDHIGLFSPNYVAENGYRYYLPSQIGLFTAISILIELGVSLKDIKSKVESLSLDNALALFAKQKEIVNERMLRYQRLNDMIDTRMEQIEKGKKVLEKGLGFSVIEIKEKTPFYFGKEINCPKDAISDEDVIDFYDTCFRKKIPFGYTFGHHVIKENILAGHPEITSHICFQVKEKNLANSYRPKGLYVVGYICGSYGKTDGIYQKLFPYLDENNLVIDGDAFEEYLFDEISMPDPKDFVLQVSIKVRRKE